MDPKYTARILTCRDCNEEFVFTAEAQEYFSGRGYNEDPEKCKSCYTKSKRDRRAGGPEFDLEEPRISNLPPRNGGSGNSIGSNGDMKRR